MGHSLTQLGTAALDTMGGLITLADPRDCPEGASPRTFDTDFIVGSVFTRPGLLSVYTYATTLVITGYRLSYNIATFNYTGTEPTVNEGFTLNGFTGFQAYLNGMIVYVESATLTSFTVALVHANDGPITGLTASAVSLNGLFVGPNVGSVAISTTWASPNNIFSPTAYTSVMSAAPINDPSLFKQAANLASTLPAWTNPNNLVTTGANKATVTLSIAAGTNGGNSPTPAPGPIQPPIVPGTN